MQKRNQTTSDDVAAPGPGAKRKRSRYLKLASRYSGYLGIRAAHCLLSLLPLRVGLALSGAVGHVGYLFARKARKNAIESLTRVYGNEFSEREILQQVRDVFRHTIATAVEFCILRRWSNEKLEAKYPHVVASVKQLEKDVRDPDRESSGSPLTSETGKSFHCSSAALRRGFSCRWRSDRTSRSISTSSIRCGRRMASRSSTTTSRRES